MRREDSSNQLKSKDDLWTWRRRYCESCDSRYTTIEMTEDEYRIKFDSKRRYKAVTAMRELIKYFKGD